MMPVKGETYFYLGRPVTVMKVEPGRCLVRAGNCSKRLDVWVTWGEIGLCAGCEKKGNYAKV